MVNALLGNFILLHDLQLYLYPNGYSVVALVGLMFAAIICYVHGFVTYNYVLHNSCNMSTHGLPDTNTLSPRACSPWASVPRLRMYISGKPLFPMLQLYNIVSSSCYFKTQSILLVTAVASYMYVCIIISYCLTDN